jgi:hypothetical protein
MSPRRVTLGTGAAMPAAKGAARPERLTEDDLIERLAPDPGSLPDVRLVSGWLGRSTRSDRWRLYVTPELNRFVEFSQAEVVHHRRLTISEVSLGGTLVWIRRDANVMETQTGPRQGQASFLNGDLMSLLHDPRAQQLFDLTMRLHPIATTIPCAAAASAKFCIAAGFAFGAAITFVLSVNLCD